MRNKKKAEVPEHCGGSIRKKNWGKERRGRLSLGENMTNGVVNIRVGQI